MKAAIMQEIRIFDPYEHANFYPDAIDALRALNVSGISNVKAIRRDESVAVDAGTLDSLLDSLNTREPKYRFIGKKRFREVEWFRFRAAIDPPVEVGTKTVTVEFYPGSMSSTPPFARNVHISGVFTAPEAARKGLRSLGQIFHEAYFPYGALYIFGFDDELKKAWEQAAVGFDSAQKPDGKTDYQKLLALEEQTRQGHRRIAEIVFPPLAGLGMVTELIEDEGKKRPIESFDVIASYWILSTHYGLSLPNVHVRLNGNGHNGFVVQAHYRDSAFDDALTGGVLMVTSKENNVAKNDGALFQLLEVCSARFAQQP